MTHVATTLDIIMNYKIYISLILILCSCNQDNLVNLSEYHPKIEMDMKSNITDAKLKWQTTGLFEPLYIGKVDSLISTQKSYLEDSRYNWRTKNLKNFGKTDANILLQIDTTNIIYQKNFNIDYDSSYESDLIQSKYYYSYPVYMMNNDVENLTVGWGDIIPITKQAKDSMGNWRTVETAFTHMCGTGLTALNLAPGEIIVTSTVLYQGDYKTKIRLHYNGVYSNEIVEYINYNQFENIFNKRGNYKPEYLREKENFINNIR